MIVGAKCALLALASGLAAFALGEAQASGSITHLVMGDWGGQHDAPYTTEQEVQTAAGMGKLAAETGATLALVLGDNFYDKGVDSVDSPRFQSTFENVFSAKSLQEPFTFNVIAGNHDHKGNVSAQIAYSGKSKRWNFPNEYFTFSETSGDGAVIQYVMIDTVELCGNSLVDSDEGLRDLRGSELLGPLSSDRADGQLAWINKTLSESKADFLVVAGHYPMYSICEHGPTPCLQKSIKPLLEEWDVTAYFNGHDHCAEHLVIPKDPKHIDYHVIGSAHSNDASTAHKFWPFTPIGALKFHEGGAGNGGFGTVTISKADGFVVRHFDGNGTMLYEAPARKPRAGSL